MRAATLFACRHKKATALSQSKLSCVPFGSRNPKLCFAESPLDSPHMQFPTTQALIKPGKPTVACARFILVVHKIAMSQTLNQNLSAKNPKPETKLLKPQSTETLNPESKT